MRGKTYDVSEVTTVQDLQDKIEAQSGISVSQQGRVIFGGKRLDASTVLSEAGVESGAHINMVPSTSKKKSSTKKTVTSASSSASGPSSGNSISAESNSNLMADYFKQAGIDPTELDNMMQKMQDGGGLEESMKAMTDALKSPVFQQLMSDPERLEQSRQMIMNNPMLKSMMSGMPGMEELLNDPEAWKEAMQAAAEVYRNMDGDQLLKAMMGGAGGLPGDMKGFFDGNLDDSATAAALDELDEDD